MTESEKAFKLDLDANYAQAIVQYELAIENGGDSVDLFINLSFLYWQAATEFSWADEFKIKANVREGAVDRYTELLELAKLKFPGNCELFFWKEYYWHRLVFDPLPEYDIVKIVEKCQSPNLIPYFYLYLFDTNKYKTQRDQLWHQCNSCLTAKNIYIKSLID